MVERDMGDRERERGREREEGRERDGVTEIERGLQRERDSGDREIDR